MIQTCTTAYWEHMEHVLARHGDPENPGEPCGKTFDDAECSTICPHNELPPAPTFVAGGGWRASDGSIR